MFDALQFTEKGRRLFLESMSGVPLVFTKIKLGEGELSGDIDALEGLIGEMLTIPAEVNVPYTGDYVIISGYLNNSELSAGFYWREVGVFVQNPEHPDDRSEDILLCYQNSAENAEYISAATQDVVEKELSIPITIEASQDISCILPDSLLLAKKADVQAALAEKVDKISGKGLSSEDFTSEEKEKLATVEEGANSYTLNAASEQELGGVKVGNGLAINAQGVMSLAGTGAYIIDQAFYGGDGYMRKWSSGVVEVFSSKTMHIGDLTTYTQGLSLPWEAGVIGSSDRPVFCFSTTDTPKVTSYVSVTQNLDIDVTLIKTGNQSIANGEVKCNVMVLGFWK